MNKVTLWILFFSFCFTQLQAEGTKDLRPNSTDYGFLNPWDWGGEFATYGAPPAKRLYVHIADHTTENIYLGFKAKNSPAYFRVKRPDGTIISGPHLIPSSGSGAGYIDTYTQAVAGPNTFNAAGYTPVVVDPDVNGDYYVEINQGHPTIPAGPPANPGGYVYQLFDISVAKPATSTIMEGRVWARLWALSTGNQFQTFNARLYVLREDSIRFEINYNSIDPFGFGIISNSWGITNTNNYVEDRKSQNQQSPPYQQGTVPYLPEHKIFLNPPDPNVYPFPQVTPSVELPPTQKNLITGCIVGGYCINVDATKAGQTEVKLDLDGVPGYQPNGRDRIVRGRVDPGVNCIPWDGFDGLGDTAYSANIEIDYQFEFGLVHIPIYDAENHIAGYIFSLMTAPGVYDTLQLYYDDSRFNFSPAGKNLSGCSVPCRNWQNFYGNERFLNTWSFAYDQSIALQNIKFSFCPPQIVDDYVDVNENTPTVLDPLINDVAPLNKIDRPSFQTFCGPFHGTVSLMSNQQLNYTPALGFIGLDSICYVVCDTANPATCDTAIIYINVKDINLPPSVTTVNNIAVNNDTVNLTTPEDISLPICMQWVEIEGDNIAAPTLISGPNNGSLINFSDGDSCFTYVPNPNYHGPDRIIIRICDDLNPPSCRNLVINITVTPVNDPPVITAGGGIPPVNDTIRTITTNEDIPKQICLTATDVDNDPTDVTAVNVAPRHGVISNIGSGNRCFLYTPDPDYYGPDSVTVTLCDNRTPALCDQVTILINVLPVNDPPVAVSDTLFLDPGQTGYRKVMLNDYDVEDPRSSLTFSLITFGNKGVATKVGDSVRYVPNASYTLGLDSVKYSLCDAGNPALCASGTLYISIPKSQVPPFAFDDAISTPEDVSVNIPILSNDFDPNLDPITPFILTQPTNGTATIVNKMVVYTPNPNYHGPDMFTYYICDNASPVPGCDTADVMITVIPVPDKPIITDASGNPIDSLSITIAEDNPVQICLNAYDGDVGQNIDVTQALSYLSRGFNTGISDGDTCFTYTPKADVYGRDSVLVSICDNSSPAQCSQIVVHILITPVNDTLIARNDSAQTNENIPVTVLPLLNDDDLRDQSGLNPNSLTVVINPANGTVSQNVAGELTYTPNPSWFGRDSIYYEVCDLGVPLPATCARAWIIIDVIPINDPPEAEDDFINTSLNTPVIIDPRLNDTDPENQPLTATRLSGPQNGSLTVVNSIFTYTPNTGFCGSDIITYQVCDNGIPTLCDSATIYINVYPSDDDNDSLANAFETLTRDTDGDGIPDYLDADSDNDGISDLVESRPRGGDICNPEPFDFDSDGVPDYLDPDSDNDGIPDWAERSNTLVKPSGIDTDRDGIDDAFDADFGGYLEDRPYNKDSDAQPDFRDIDSDGDGIPDWIEAQKPTAQGGKLNWRVPSGADSDGDGIDDAWDTDNGGPGLYELPEDTDSDGQRDFRDLDSDDDGISDLLEKGSNGNNPRNSDGDSLPDFRDTDSDNDGNPDSNEGFGGDCDNDGIPDYLDNEPCLPSIPEGFSPNGDGVNDTFIIPGYDPSVYPNSSLKIFNRWGNLVYSMAPYDNGWGGETSVKGVFGSSEFLPAGTYFYVFDFGNGITPLTGYVLLKR